MTFETHCDKCGGANGEHLNCTGSAEYQAVLRSLTPDLQEASALIKRDDTELLDALAKIDSLAGETG